MDSPSTITPTAPPAGARHKIEMVFRLWSQAKSFDSPESNGFTRYQEILAMIEDVAASRRANLIAAGEQLSVTGLKRASDALIVSRQIQLGLQGFRSRSMAEPVGLSIAINSWRPSGSSPWPEDGAIDPSAFDHHEPQPSHDLLSLLKISKPAQVLVTHDLSEQVGIYRGLPLRSFPGRFGVSEYLWTSTEKLDLLQSEPQLTLTTVPDLPRKPASAQEPATAVPDPASPGEESAPFLMLRSADKPEPNWRTSLADPRKAAAIAAAVLVFSAGLWGMYGAFRSAMKVPAPASHESSPEQPHAQSPSSLTSGPGPSARPRGATPSKTNTASATAASKVSKSSARAVITQPATSEARKRGCDLDSDEIPWYLRKAEESRQQGQYPLAIHRFQMVLACQSNNPDAVAGLAKAKAALDGQ